MKKIVPALIAVALVVATVFVLRSSVFVVKKIIVSDVSCATADEVRQRLAIQGKSIFFIKGDLTEKVQSILCIESTSYTKKYPDTIDLTIKEREAIVRLSSYVKNLDLDLGEASVSSQTALIDWSFPVSSQSSFAVADKTGLIFAETSDFGLPVLLVEGVDLKLGEKVKDPNFYRIQVIISKLKELVGFNLMKLDGISVLIDATPKIAFSIERDELIQLGSLQLLLQKAKIDGREIKYVDLRFNKPIVTYGKGK